MMARTMSTVTTLSLLGALALVCVPAAHAATIASIDGRSAVTGSATTTFTDASGTTIRCRHDITIPTTAFSGTSSVSVEAANNVYSNCRDSLGGTCLTTVNGRWTITTPTTTSGTIRLDSSVSVDCTNRGLRPYSCVFTVRDSQSLTATFTNPVSPATTGSLRIDGANSITYTVENGSTRCPLGDPGARSTATMAETISTENAQTR